MENKIYPEALTPNLRRIRKWSMRTWCIFLPLLAVVGYLIAKTTPIPQAYKYPSLLGGPAGLAIFTIVVALSAYLRSVAGAADERREEIRAGKVALYPWGQRDGKDCGTKLTEEKLKALTQTFGNLQVGAELLIVLTFVVALRLLVESWFKVTESLTPSVEFYVRIWDVLILIWLLFATVGLAIMHWVARSRDDRLRTGAEKEQDAVAKGQTEN
jgi:hypothetical protein